MCVYSVVNSTSLHRLGFVFHSYMSSMDFFPGLTNPLLYKPPSAYRKSHIIFVELKNNQTKIIGHQVKHKLCKIEMNSCEPNIRNQTFDIFTIV